GPSGHSSAASTPRSPSCASGRSTATSTSSSSPTSFPTSAGASTRRWIRPPPPRAAEGPPPYRRPATMDASETTTPTVPPALSAEPLPAVEPDGTRALFHQLLSQPLAPVERAQRGKGGGTDLKLLLGGLAGFALYGAAAGLFQGGGQILLAAAKAPLIAFVSLL